MRPVLLALIMLFSISLNACGQSANLSPDEEITAEAVQVSSNSNTPPSTTAERIKWASGSCGETRQLLEVLRIGSTELERNLGEPERRETFRLGSRQDEFHVQLQNTYPLSVPENADVELAEWTWSEGECRLTVWLHRREQGWQSFDSLVWNEDAEFQVSHWAMVRRRW